jgi:hypothetical protein
MLGIYSEVGSRRENEVMTTSKQQLMFAQFELLWDDLPNIRRKVAALELPISDDDMVKTAITGYSYHQPIASWGRDEVEVLTCRRREIADLGRRWEEFVCLASGYLLGLYQSGRCNGADRTLFEALLPGFMWLHSERFT